MKKAYITVFTLLFIAACPSFTRSQSSGTFVMQKSVIANGGGQSAGNVFVLNGTIGETLSGTGSTGGVFQLGGGFWSGSSQPAANVMISGRIFTSNGVTGLRNATVTLTDGNDVVKSTTTSSFGFYSFDNVPPGFSYTLRIKSRLFRFQPQVVVPTGDLTGVDFVGFE